MKRAFSRLIGVILIFASIAGLLICIGGIVGAWQVRRALSANLLSTIDLLDTTLKATLDGLQVADQSLEGVSTSVDILSATLAVTSKSVEDSLPLFDTLTELSTEEFPVTLTSAQDALDAAQKSAGTIDSTLSMLSAIPFLPMEPYDPETSLAEALGDVSKSLDPLPDSLVEMRDPLVTAQGNISAIGGQLGVMAANIGQINSNLSSAQDVIAQYHQVVAQLQTRLDTSRASLPGAVDGIAWFATVLLGWLGITQIGLMMQGLEMVGFEIWDKGDTPRADLPPESAATMD